MLIKLFYGHDEIGIYDTIAKRCVLGDYINDTLRALVMKNMKYLSAMFEYGMPEGNHFQLYKNHYFEDVKRGYFPWLSTSSNFSTAEPGLRDYIPVPDELPSGVIVSTDINPELFSSRNAVKRGVIPSFSGYKDKFPGVLKKVNGVYTVSILDKNSEAGNVIVKPQCPRYPFICENEFIFMQLASRVGIQVPRTWLCLDKTGIMHYCVERFGIYRDPQGSVLKENMVDFLGAMDVRAKDKYIVSIEDLFEAAEKILNTYDLNSFARMWYYGFIVGNTDMHPKNFSLFIRDGMKWKLAPAYDMVHMPCYGIQGTSCLKQRNKSISPSKSDIDLFITKYITQYEAGEIRNVVFANIQSIVNNVFRVSLKQNNSSCDGIKNIKKKMLEYFTIQ